MNSVTFSLTLVLFAFGVSSKGFPNNGPSTRLFENEIIAISECIRGILIEGDPEGSFPSFEPLILDNSTVNFNEWNIPELISGETDLTDVHIDGLTSWNFTYLSDAVVVAPKPGVIFYFDVLYPSISGHLTYFGNVTILEETDLSEEFSGKVVITGLRIFGDIVVNLDLFDFDKLHIDIAVEDFQWEDDESEQNNFNTEDVHFSSNTLKPTLIDSLKKILTRNLVKSMQQVSQAAEERGLIDTILSNCIFDDLAH